MSDYAVTVPWSPTCNTYYKHTKTGAFLSARGRAYREAVAAAVVRKGPPPRFAGPLAITLRCVRPDVRRRDLDNLLKSLFDSLLHAGVYLDDSQVEEIHATMAPPEKPGRIEVSIRLLPSGSLPSPELDSPPQKAKRAPQRPKK